ncbi:MAG: hydantoinase B/oxoprolinase family protein [Pseudomonadota bacterium]
MPSLNNIELSLFSSRINAICEEMGEVLRLSAFSPNIKDRLDFSCAIFDASGQLCAQAAHIPVHLGSMAYAMQDIVSQVTWLEGDMIVLNDPYKGGTHLPDVTIIAPLFLATNSQSNRANKKQLIAFIVNRAHHADIGASTPGSMPLSSSLEEEGLILSLEKIVQNFQLDKNILSSICNHMSDKTASGGDFMAQISANKAGLARLKELITSMQSSSFKQAVEQLNSYAERIALSSITTIPSGKYEFIDYLDDDGQGKQQIAIQVSIEVSEKQINVDFSGTEKQVSGNINCPLSVTAAAVYYVFRCLMPDYTPACAGTFSLIHIKAPKGCLINAIYPAAVAAGNVETSTRIVDVLLGALVKAIPDKIPAASYGTMNNIAMGNNQSQRQAWNYYETIGGGMGASFNANGLTAVQAHMTNTLNTPVESLEYHFPMRIKSYSIRQNSGGIGDFTGGNGIIRQYEMLQQTEVTLLTERRINAPWGLGGAINAQSGENWLDQKRLVGKTHFTAEPGQVLTIKTPGGGGFSVKA